jgi:hypothetical protein
MGKNSQRAGRTALKIGERTVAAECIHAGYYFRRMETGDIIVAKGNMSLTFLQNAEPDEVYEAGQEIIRRAGSDKFILSVSDVLLGNHSRENVEALIRAGHDFKFQS